MSAIDVVCRRARAEDAPALWRIANDPGVRANSFRQDPIPYEEHLQWFAAKLASPACSFWVLDHGAEIVAQIRYERAEDGAAELHFAVDPEFRGRGVGTLALEATAEGACRDLDARRVRGVVFAVNAASRRAFEKAGFSLVDCREIDGRECVVFERIREE
jgi:UDP-2,4-diacetamido-2,4,6-trideoxy-beta-L-altropyranose hydrolase